MQGQKEDTTNSQANSRDTSKDTRRIRGLSRRLQRPLSPESNLDDPWAPPLETPPETPPVAAPDNTLKTHTIGVQSIPGDNLLETRQVAGHLQPAASSKPAALLGQDGLLPEAINLQNRYKILGVIGVGGMGAVYKAQDMRFPNVMRICAVKEMINTASDPQMRQMIIRNFEREASILATLSHPAIPQVYDYFTQESRSYLVLEYVSGQDLEACLSETEGFFSEAQVLNWAVQMCDVLAFLHNNKPRPIVFRDLKPSNIMLDAHNRIRLVDFGIAKLFQSGEKGTMIGTEGYAPPEQYRGIAEPRCDVYALCATLHHLLSKQDPRLEPPFSFHERPVYKTNPTVSRELVEVLERGLEYDINKRWGSAEELKRAFLALSAARGLQASNSQAGETSAFDTGMIKPQWRFACEDEIRGSLAIANEMVYVPSYDHNLYALEQNSGKFVWKYAAENGIGASPLIVEGNVVVFGSTDTVVYGVDARTGRLAWTVPTQGKVYSSPASEFGHIFIGSDDRNLYAIHALSGRLSWKFMADGAIRVRPAIGENMIIFACQQGMVYALNLNREVRWRFRARRAFLSSPVIHDGLVYIGSVDWNLYALDLRSGWSAWRYRAGGPIISTPAVWNKQICFGSTDGYLYALDLDGGRLIWRYQTEDQITASPLFYNEAVYFGGVDGYIYCLDAQTGTLRWRYQTEGPITSTPVIEAGILYIGSSDHYVYAIPV